MGVLRRRIVLRSIATASLAACLALPGHAAAAASLTLVGEEDGRAKYDFGESRANKVLTLVYNASEAVSSPPSVVLSDAKGKEGLFDGSLSAAAEVVGEGIVKVNVTVEPGSVSPGSYGSEVLLRGGGIQSTNTPLVLEFSRSPSEAAAAIIAIALLIVGVALGGLLRWLSGSGTKLRLLSARYEQLSGSFEGDEWTPLALKRALAEVRVWLGMGEVESAEERLNAVANQAEAVLSVMQLLVTLKDKVDDATARVGKLSGGVEASAATRLQEALGRQREWLEQIREKAYPDPDGEKDSREEEAGWISEFEAFLAEYEDPAKRQGKWDDALTRYSQGEFATAKATWSEPIAADVAAPSPQTPAPVVPAEAGWAAKVKWWAIRHSPALVGVLIALGVVMVGLQTVFDPKTMFLEDDFRDGLSLIAWGFGSALVGLTTTELASKVMPKPSA